MASTSFQRKNLASKNRIRGTKSDGQELLISTGVPSFDECIGGGLAVGSVLLIEEDAGSIYSELFSKYFIAEGVSHDHEIILCPSDVSSDSFLQNIPTAVDKERPSAYRDPATNEPLKIAWRYQQVQSVPPLARVVSRSFDWNQPVSKEKLSQVTCYDSSLRYSAILGQLAKKLPHHESINQVLRLVIQGLGNPLWEDEENALKFLYAVRCLCRTYSITCLMTTATYWMRQEPGRADQVRRLADVVIELNTLEEHEKNKHPHLKNYDGILCFHRMCRPNTLFSRNVNKTRDLAFSVKRKVLTIEKMHLPPILSEDPIIKTSPVNLCASRPGTSALDF